MDQEALVHIFKEAFESHSDAIFRFCVFKVTNVPVAEDLTQETYTRFWQALRRGSEMTNTRAYLYTIARNLVKDWYKKKKSESLDLHIDRGLEPRASDALDPEVGAEYNEVLSHLLALKPNDAEVLLLRFVEGLDPKDIAVLLGETPNTISVRINRAVARLQKILHTDHA